LNSELWRSLRRYSQARHNRPLQRRPDSELDFLGATKNKPTKILYDTTVYIDILQHHFPEPGKQMLRAGEAWHSPVTEGELAMAVGLLDPSHPSTPQLIAEIAGVIERRPAQRTIVPDVVAWREAGILSGILARLQGFDNYQRRRVLNDALLFVTARRHGCTLLTRNISDFDFLQQLEPAGRVLFYRT
jgi:predicted nucleic acid-binding protein